ncbi:MULTISPECIES: hypothetical protein [unclassified Streptomyces]|uniref:hypothetical protein n=1 Tax=unclassified Streptomyces TaxID=2593676 RepID=UPI0022B66875|nr:MULTISPECIES: hypothetical protein [unclassified Streptomyces]MCZ7414776.1 hypothetical protein [Streptomyces sp. WMMC897]MCZ7431700.1 hypothetical protein [Streptomyces sp. WMMC1477]
MRRTAGLGLALGAVLLVALSPGRGGADPPRSEPPADAAAQGIAAEQEPSPPRPAPKELVQTPVRIADEDVVRLLTPGDRVDVLAGPPASAFAAAPDPDGGSRAGPGAGADAAAGAHTEPDGGATATVLAQRARVVQVPEPDPRTHAGGAVTGTLAANGALVVLSVPRSTAARLVGRAALGAPLAVTLR